MKRHYFFYILMPLLLLSNKGFAQSDSLLNSKKLGAFERASSFHPVRFWTLTGLGVAGYAGVTVGLDQAWYAGYPRGKFHFFDDWNGWRQMDKFGHAMTGYFESKWAGDMYRWAGIPQREAAWVGFGTGMLFQTTLEVLDGFSSQWGFSWGDMAFNTIGSGLYLGQELLWKEQRIKLKMSTHPPDYPSEIIYATNNTGATTSLRQRANKLFGTSPAELLFKEYNGQTIWLSLNIASFMKERPHGFPPPWLNIAVGYGIENVYGAERNSWTDDAGNTFVVPSQYPRYSQFFLSLDIDLERIPTKHKWLRTIFSILNIFKIPFPTMEVNTLGQVEFHPFYF